jgi:hypothetical protein
VCFSISSVQANIQSHSFQESFIALYFTIEKINNQSNNQPNPIKKASNHIVSTMNAQRINQITFARFKIIFKGAAETVESICFKPFFRA